MRMMVQCWKMSLRNLSNTSNPSFTTTAGTLPTSLAVSSTIVGVFAHGWNPRRAPQLRSFKTLRDHKSLYHQIMKSAFYNMVISPGELILSDSPTILSPPTRCRPQCLQCSRILPNLDFVCSRCWFPLCGPPCQDGDLHR